MVVFRHIIRTVRAGWRQLGYHRALRITLPVLPPAAEALALIRELRERAATGAADASVPVIVAGSPPAALPVESTRLLAALCTSVWSLRRRMLDPETDRPRSEFRRAFSDVRVMWRELEDHGVSIIDHTREEYDDGLSLDVAAFQPVEELTRNTVVETIKPTVILDGQRIQTGEVVVGTPPRRADI